MASAPERSTTVTLGTKYSLGYKGACLRVVKTCRSKLMARRGVARSTMELLAAECLLNLFSKDRCSGVPCDIMRYGRRVSRTLGVTEGDYMLLGGSKILPVSGSGMGAVNIVKPGTSDHTTLVKGCRKASSRCVAILRKVHRRTNSSMEVLCSRKYSLCGSGIRGLT